VSPARRAAVLAAGVIVALAGSAPPAAGAVGGEASGSGEAAGGGRRPTAAVVSDVGPAGDPFDGLTAGTVKVGGRALEVVVADSLGERTQGLRGRSDAAPYAGMLFVFPEDSTVAFTMAGVPDALDIAFFDARGRRVDALRMTPCVGTDATCPVYESDAPYRYTLETAAGEMPAGRLRVRRG
jgi:uncharacterized membrane protein (UPF0127 family)